MDDVFQEVSDQDGFFAERDRLRTHRDLWNAGYLAGIEWAEGNYLTEVVSDAFFLGVEAGQAKAPVDMFREAGRLK